MSWNSFFGLYLCGIVDLEIQSHKTFNVFSWCLGLFWRWSFCQIWLITVAEHWIEQYSICRGGGEPPSGASQLPQVCIDPRKNNQSKSKNIADPLPSDFSNKSTTGIQVAYNEHFDLHGWKDMILCQFEMNPCIRLTHSCLHRPKMRF